METIYLEIADISSTTGYIKFRTYNSIGEDEVDKKELCPLSLLTSDNIADPRGSFNSCSKQLTQSAHNSLCIIKKKYEIKRENKI